METQNESTALPEPAATADRFNVLRVAIAGLCLVVLAGVIFVMAVYSVGPPQRLVQATGTVTWDGKPVTVGAVMTVLENDPTFSSIGALDQQGRFTLSTNGEADGTAVGRHKLVVASFGDGMPPPPLVPAEYTTLPTTPLVIDVSSDPARNHFEIKLTGELPKRGNRPPPREGEPPDAPASPPRPGGAAAAAEGAAPDSESGTATQEQSNPGSP